MATLPAPADAVSGAAATSSGANTWRDGLKFLLGITNTAYGQKPFAVMRQTVAQSIPTATWTALNFDTEDVDYDNGHSTTTNTDRYTANLAGWHLAFASCGYAANATGQRILGFAVNGTRLNAGGQALPATLGTIQMTLVAFRPVYLNLADSVNVHTYQDSGGALNTNIPTNDPRGPMFGVIWVSS